MCSSDLELGRLHHHVGSVTQFAHRLVERRAQLALEAVRHLLELAVGLAEAAHRVRELLGAEHDQGDEEQEDHLAAIDVEHGGSLGGGSCRPAAVPWQDRAVQQRLRSLLDPPITFGHRGARAYAPENTLESFELALRLGATGLESDVWLTADGEPVLDHDGVVRRRFGRSTPITEVRRGELPSHIPSLTDLLTQRGTAFSLSLDLKDPRAGGPVLEVVEAADPSMLPRLWLCSPQRSVLHPLRGRGARLVDSTRLSLLKEGPEQIGRAHV
mgnify:CR=1 FL=1